MKRRTAKHLPRPLRGTTTPVASPVRTMAGYKRAVVIAWAWLGQYRTFLQRFSAMKKKNNNTTQAPTANLWVESLLKFIPILIALCALYFSAQTLLRGQRPWVTVTSFKVTAITSTPGDVSRLQGVYTLKNTGVSIATDGSVQAIFLPASLLKKHWDDACAAVKETEESAKMQKEKDITPWPLGFVLAPGQENSSTGWNGPMRSNLDDNQTEGFFVLGCVSYRDQFLRSHQTRFCFMPNPESYIKDQTITETTDFVKCQFLETAD